MEKNRFGELTKSELQKEIRDVLDEENNVYEFESKYITQIEKSRRVYSISNDGEKIEIENEEMLVLAKYIDEIKSAYESAKKNSSVNAEIFNQVKENLNYEEANYTIGSVSMVIKTQDGYNFTLIEDGTVLQGLFAYLNIADGAIDLYKTGYKQNNGDLVEYTGGYVITGTTTTNSVRVMEEGTYNITIKDLSIDVSSINGQCPFNANRGDKTNNCFVNIKIEGNNYLCAGKLAAGLGFANATPNINGETTGSTLTIQGEGCLESIGGQNSAGIGSGYSGAEAAAGTDVNNIIIYSGNIIAKGTAHGAGIGGALYDNVNNIIINGGNIETSSISGPAIGTGILRAANADNIVINGGNIKATGGIYGPAIGGIISSGKVIINGGEIETNIKDDKWNKNWNIGALNVEINGGTINTKSNYWAGLACGLEGNIKIKGGSILTTGGFPIGKVDENDELVSNIPIDGTNNLYLAPIQLSNIKEKTKINSISTSDNISYGTTDMYTSEEGILYLYLPQGERTITIETDKKSYKGKVTTNESNDIAIL